MANIVVLTGPVEKVEESFTQQNKRVVKFTVKTTEHYQGKSFDSWHKIERWSEDLQLSDGQRVEVVGKLKHTSWEKKDGTKGYRTYVNAGTVAVDGPVESQYAPAPEPSDDDDLPF